MFNAFYKNINERGFTLIEMMLSVIVSAVILVSLFSIYIGSKKALNLQIAITHFLYQAQHTADILTANISRAGNIGCSDLNHIKVDPYLEYDLTTSNKLIGNQSSIIVRQLSESSSTAKQLTPNKLKVSRQVIFKPQDILFISDCIHAEIFQVKDILLHPQSQTIVAVQPFKNQYDDAKVRHFKIQKFFVAETKRKTLNGKKIYALFKKDLIKNRQLELMEGITNLQLKYSMIDHGKLVDKSYADISDWAAVVGVATQLTIEAQHFKKSWYLYAPLKEITYG